MKGYDIIIWGATSFAGKYVTEYLLNKRNASVKVAIAGRSRSKLEELNQTLGSNADIFVGDALDQEFIADLVSNTSVVLSTVGPYALYGSLLVEEVVKQGKAYCDLTGEPQWIWQMLQQHEQHAKQTGAQIIHCCGFDSIPSDAGVYYLQQTAQQQFGSYCQQIHYRFKRSKGGFSGGTVATMVNAIKQIKKNKQQARVLKTPYSLLTKKSDELPFQPSVKSLQHDKETNQYLVPFIMASINTKIVHRTNELLGYPWQTSFLYDESMQMGTGLKGWWRGMKVMLGLTLFAILISNRVTRPVMEKYVLPKPGQGPTEELVRSGYFVVELIGHTAKGQTLTASVSGQGDPGYGSTAKMISEAAVMLCEKQSTKTGFLTPIAAFENTLVDRLTKHADLKFEHK